MTKDLSPFNPNVGPANFNDVVAWLPNSAINMITLDKLGRQSQFQCYYHRKENAIAIPYVDRNNQPQEYHILQPEWDEVCRVIEWAITNGFNPELTYWYNNTRPQAPHVLNPIFGPNTPAICRRYHECNPQTNFVINKHQLAMKKYPYQEIRDTIVKYHNNDFSVIERNASFDLCYAYFQQNKDNLAGDNIERSCFQLYGYLASWGMLRRSKLRGESPAALKQLIEYFATKCDKEVWDINVSDYSCNSKVKLLCELYKDIVNEIAAIKVTPTVTLVTKIMLGVFGNIPALDTNFKKWMNYEFQRDYRYYSINETMVSDLGEFYAKNKESFGRIEFYSLNINGKETEIIYPQARLLDMFGFAKGESL